MANVIGKETLGALPLILQLFYARSQGIPSSPPGPPTPISSTCLLPGPPVYQLGVIPLAQGIRILLQCKQAGHKQSEKAIYSFYNALAETYFDNRSTDR